MRKLIGIFALCILTLTACADKPASEKAESENNNGTAVVTADYPYYETNEKLVEAADLIFIGKIKSVEAKMLDVKTYQGKDPDTGLEEASLVPYSIYEIEVSEMLKGDKGDKTVYVKILGGEVDGTVYESKLNLSVDDECMFLTKNTGDEYLSILNDDQSVYYINKESEAIDKIKECIK